MARDTRSDAGSFFAPDTASVRGRSAIARANPADEGREGLEGVLHDLANLTDAALRCASAARRATEPARNGDGGNGGDDARRSILAIDAALTQMADMIGALGGPRRHAGVVIGVRDAVVQGVELMRPLAEEAGIELAAHVDDGFEMVRCPGLMRLVTEGVRNAIDAIEMGRARGTSVGEGRIEVTARREAALDSDNLVVRVYDNGPGVSGVADPFVAGVTGKANGSGLGLSVSRLMVERLKGTITLRSHAGGARGAVLEAVIPMTSLHGRGQS